MAMNESMGGPMGGPMMAAQEPVEPAAETDIGNEKASVFLTQSQLGDRKVRAGDTLTLTVRDVDPETGDVQADLAEGGEYASTGGYASDFDEAIPEE